MIQEVTLGPFRDGIRNEGIQGSGVRDVSLPLSFTFIIIWDSGIQISVVGVVFAVDLEPPGWLQQEFFFPVHFPSFNHGMILAFFPIPQVIPIPSLLNSSQDQKCWVFLPVINRI